MFSNWFFRKRKLGFNSPQLRQARRPKARFQPQLEILEDRLAPAILTVTSALDDGGPGTLRSIMDAAGISGDVDTTIKFAPSLAGQTITIDPNRLDPDVGRTGIHWFGNNLTIEGPGSPENQRVTISGNPLINAGSPYFNFFEYNNGAPLTNRTVTLSNLNFENMVTESDFPGGAIYVSAYGGFFATVNMDHCDLLNNSSGEGGAIGVSFQTVNLNDCTLANNSTISQYGNGFGGAIGIEGGTVNLTNCTLSNNSANGDFGGNGGAIWSSGSLTLNGCTLSNNTAVVGTVFHAGAGGAIDTSLVSGRGGGSLTILCSTVSGNSGPLGADVACSGATIVGSTIGNIYSSGTITTPDSTATSLETQISALSQARPLTATQAAGLTSKVQAAQQSLDNCNLTSGANQLNAFINQVNAFVKSNTLTSAQAQSLINPANQLLTALNVPGAHLLNDPGNSTTTDTQPVTDAGQLVTGPIGVYLDNADGTPVPADEQARFDDAIATLDTTFGTYGVDLVDVGVGGAANAVVQVEIAGTSAAGGAADGVLGCTVAGQITLLTGWNWYTGSDPSVIGAGQYDFETIVMHELGHAIGLGHSGDTNSVMYAYLAPGQTRRVVTTADLSVLDSPSTAPHALLAVPWHDAASSSGSRLNSAVAPANAKERPAPALVPINPALANALAFGSANIVVVQPAVVVEPTVNQANVSMVGTLASVRQNVAVDQFLVQISQNATTNESSQPEHVPPVNAPETNLLEENAQPLEPVSASDSGNDYGGLLGDALALEEAGTATWQHACDACFADDDWSPRSETIAAGSLIAVGMAANPTLLDNLVRVRSMHGRERNKVPALAKR
jgi:hypothetical protein